MRIAVSGGGAMGIQCGGYLSRRHDALIVDRKQALADKAGRAGLRSLRPTGQGKRIIPRL